MCWTWGSPVKRADLAESTIRFSGLIPNKDIKITYTGIREGEKIEEVFSPRRKNWPYEKGNEKTNYFMLKTNDLC